MTRRCWGPEYFQCFPIVSGTVVTTSWSALGAAAFQPVLFLGHAQIQSVVTQQEMTPVCSGHLDARGVIGPQPSGRSSEDTLLEGRCWHSPLNKSVGGILNVTHTSEILTVEG